MTISPTDLCRTGALPREVQEYDISTIMDSNFVTTTVEYL